jgi:Helix-turn-helix domain
MNPDVQAEGLWDVRDVAAYYKASRSWVYQQAESGMLPCLRIGGLLRFDPFAVRAFARGEGTLATALPLRAKRKPNDRG